MTQTILVTGATGFIASRLIPRLLAAGYTVRCLARRPERLKGRAWYPKVETFAGDVTRPETLSSALKGVSAAYYLIHSMSAGRSYDFVDRQSARDFAQAAKTAGLEHIIYLGGLADPREPGLAMHLKSRLESGSALREAGVPVTEFHAGVIVGPGSVSFEMIRFIMEQFPVLLGPSWLYHRSQPIAASNVLDFLLAALSTPACHDRIIELGSQETMTYLEVMARYAQIRGLKRILLPVPPIVPVGLMAFLIARLTPVRQSYALPLVKGLQNDSLVLDRTPLSLFPAIELLDYTSAVQRALAETHPAEMERIWLDQDQDAIEIKHEGMFIDYRRAKLAAESGVVFSAVQRLANSPLRVGLIGLFEVDFLGENTLRLKVIQKIPGNAWLEWKVTPSGGGTLLEQTVFFAPKGLPGFLGWYLLNPLYRWSFVRLLKRLTIGL
jgi:uncharacterized protein YbjT (DUF2867 family)